MVGGTCQANHTLTGSSWLMIITWSTILWRQMPLQLLPVCLAVCRLELQLFLIHPCGVSPSFQSYMSKHWGLLQYAYTYLLHMYKPMWGETVLRVLGEAATTAVCYVFISMQLLFVCLFLLGTWDAMSCLSLLHSTWKMHSLNVPCCNTEVLFYKSFSFKMKSNQAEQKVPFPLNIKENRVLDLFVLFFKTKFFFL